MTGRRPPALAATVAIGLAALAGCVADDTAGPEPTVGEVEREVDTVPRPTTTQPTTTTTRPTTTTTRPTTTTTTIPVATTVVEPPGPLVGIAVPEHRIRRIEAIEREVGARFHLVRVFLRWEDDPTTDEDIAGIQADNRAIHLSVRPVRDDGTVIPWIEIAETPEGSALHDEMVQWAEWVVAMGPDLRFTFNHEPETADSAPNGDAPAYVAAWRRMAELVRAAGGEETTLVWTVGVDLLSLPEAEAWYPGDDVVDVVGADLYNWFTCQGTQRDWVDFERLVRPALIFAQRHDKLLDLPEFASAEDLADPDRRAAWITDATEAMLTPPEVDRLAVVSWFDVTAPGGTYPDCRWTHDGDEATQDAFGEMVRRLVGP